MPLFFLYFFGLIVFFYPIIIMVIHGNVTLKYMIKIDMFRQCEFVSHFCRSLLSGQGLHVLICSTGCLSIEVMFIKATFPCVQPIWLNVRQQGR